MSGPRRFLWPARLRSNSVSPGGKRGWMNARGGMGGCGKRSPRAGRHITGGARHRRFRASHRSGFDGIARKAGSLTPDASLRTARHRLTQSMISYAPCAYAGHLFRHAVRHRVYRASGKRVPDRKAIGRCSGLCALRDRLHAHNTLLRSCAASRHNPRKTMEGIRARGGDVAISAGIHCLGSAGAMAGR